MFIYGLNFSSVKCYTLKHFEDKNINKVLISLLNKLKALNIDKPFYTLLDKCIIFTTSG